MQGIQIGHNILQAIFIDQSKFQPQIIKELIQWNQQLQPSVNMTQSIISSFLLPSYDNLQSTKDENENHQKKQNRQVFSKQQLNRVQKAVCNIPKTLILLQQNKCPKNFMRAFLLFIKKNMNTIQYLLKKQLIFQQWTKICSQLLQNYCDTFSIKIQKYSKIEINEGKVQQKGEFYFIKSQEFDNKIFEMIEKKQYSNCMALIKFSNCQKHHINKLLSKMTNNKDSSRAADYIKSLKLDPSDYPALGQRLYKNTARHFLSKNGWEYTEEIFQNHPQALACIVQDLIFKKKYSEALSIWYRNQSCRDYIVKEEALLYLNPYIQSKGLSIKIEQLKQNILRKDQFEPSNRQKYFSLHDFGIREQQVIWIDQNTNQTQQYMNRILDSQALGIDTESIVGQTKFEKSQNSKFQQAALIQIATKNNIFIVDGFKAKNIPIIKQTILSYIKGNGLIVGHSLDNDIECLLKSLGCQDQEIKNIKNIKLLDIWKLFKAVYPDQKFSSLAFITQTMLGKQICKDQTLTNWQRRPLRRNQLHYAAMDAFIVLRIYDKFIEQIGQQMIAYYSSMDGNQF